MPEPTPEEKQRRIDDCSDCLVDVFFTNPPTNEDKTISIVSQCLADYCRMKGYQNYKFEEALTESETMLQDVKDENIVQGDINETWIDGKIPSGWK